MSKTEKNLIEEARKFSLACATSLKRNGKSLCWSDLGVAYIKGYQQAEKNLELTWEDVSLLRSILFDVEHEGFTNFPYEEFCKEVLKRFNKQRNDRH